MSLFDVLNSIYIECMCAGTNQTSQPLLSVYLPLSVSLSLKMFVSFKSSKWELEIWVAAEVVLTGPVDGALYKEMTPDFDGMRTGAQDKCVCVCVCESKEGEIEK